MIRDFKPGDVFTSCRPLSKDRIYFVVGLPKEGKYPYAFSDLDAKPTKLPKGGSRSKKSILSFLRDKDFDVKYVFSLDPQEDKKNYNLFDIDDI